MPSPNVLKLYSTLRSLKDRLYVKDCYLTKSVIKNDIFTSLGRENELLDHLLKIKLLVNGKGNCKWNHDIGLTHELCEKIYADVYLDTPKSKPKSGTVKKEPDMRMSEREKIEKLTKLLKYLFGELLSDYKTMNLPDKIVEYGIGSKWVIAMKLTQMEILSKKPNGNKSMFKWVDNNSPNEELAIRILNEAKEYAKTNAKKNYNKTKKNKNTQQAVSKDELAEGTIRIIEPAKEVATKSLTVETEAVTKQETKDKEPVNTQSAPLAPIEEKLSLNYNLENKTVTGYFDSIEVGDDYHLVKLAGLVIASVPKNWLIIKTTQNKG